MAVPLGPDSRRGIDDSGISGGEGELFGALVRSTSADVNDRLGLPALPSDHKHISLLPHKVQLMRMPCSQECSSSLLPCIPTLPPSSSSPSSLEPLEERLSLLKMALPSTEQPMLRGWEGWLSDHCFLCDATPPVTCHLAQILTSKYTCLAGLTGSMGTMQAHVVEEPCLFFDGLLQQLDEVDYMVSHPWVESNHVLFSVSRCLQSLLVSCRTKMLVLAGQSVLACSTALTSLPL